MSPRSIHFESKPSIDIRRRLSSVVAARPNVASITSFASLTPMWAGIAGALTNNGTTYEVAISIHDSVYSTDFSSHTMSYSPMEPEKTAIDIQKHVLDVLRKFSSEHLCKFLGAGVTLSLLHESPNICTRLWLDLDIVPIVFNIKPYHTESSTKHIKHRMSVGNSRLLSGTETPLVADLSILSIGHSSGATLGAGLVSEASHRVPIPKTLDEQADSAARKCLMYFGPNHNPRLTIGSRNQVAVDAGGKIHLVDDLNEYRKTVGKKTWSAVTKLADELREKKVKIGFFSSTPQGGGVALMRHALIRFVTSLDVDVAWYVPNPSPSVFRITKNNHNILQGVARPDLRLTKENKDLFDSWILKNGLRWTAEGGPLAPGGVDIVFIDDPQMPGLIPLIKKVRPNVPIIYRSHIEIRSDLVHVPGSPQEEVWNYLWNNIKRADLFISHPVSKFVPDDVPIEKLALLGASTDWLDGLSKPLRHWDLQYNMGEFRSLCAKEKMNELRWPLREYIVQIARFDPAKGIPDVINSYCKFRRLLEERAGIGAENDEAPQLLLCGHGAVDDPDASIIYDQTMQLIGSKPFKDYAHDITVMRLPPSDQLLNALLTNAKFALQLSTREGFEVKVSEALHHGKPIIACQTGGIPLQVEHGKSGFLVTPGDHTSVAQHMYDLFTDDDLFERMSEYARSHVSDEVGTVGNAAAWLYLAVMYSRGVKLRPKGAWINDLLREETGELYEAEEPRLPRSTFHLPVKTAPQ